MIHYSLNKSFFSNSGKRKILQVTLFAIFFLQFFILDAQEVIWEAEAETGTIAGTAEIVSGCSNASGGEFVRLNSDSGNSLSLDNIEVPDSGYYRLIIDYFYLGERPLAIIVNDSSAGIFYFPEATWCFQGPPSKFAVDIFLNEGMNYLQFLTYNNNNAPFIDKLQITGIFRPCASLQTSADRVLLGESTDITVLIEEVTVNDETVFLSIDEGLPGDKLVRDTAVVIRAGEQELKFKITNSVSPDEEILNIFIQIDSVSSGLLVSEMDSLHLKFVEHPSRFYISNSEGNNENDGTATAPWKSIEKAVNYSFIPGDSILLKAGDTFTGQLRITLSGTRSSPLYYGSYGEGSKPVIEGADDPGGAFTSAILANNASHIVLEGLEITNDRKISRPGTDDQIGFGVNIQNDGDEIMEDVVLRDLTIRDVYAISIEGVEFNSVKVAGVQINSEINTLEGKAKHIRDVLIEDCYITHTGKYGIWSRHGGAWQNVGNDTLNRNMNIVIRNNHFFETGGAGITLSRCYNALLENNLIDSPGSDHDPRTVSRGSGAWFWKCNNILARYNQVLHARGPLDSYGIHVDWGNRDVFIQYNYTEDIEGGFVEILGDNANSVYRYNVSVNDGFREYRGNSIWISRFAGNTDEGTTWIASDNNYIYNNTIYVDDTLTPGIEIRSKNTYVYNNIFYASGEASIADPLDIWPYDDAEIIFMNNLYYGEVNSWLYDYDNQPFIGDPLFTEPGASDTLGYKLKPGSIAIDTAFSFAEPSFPMAGKGIFKNIDGRAVEDFYGNPVNISEEKFNVGAFNGTYKDTSKVNLDKFNSIQEDDISIYPNPASISIKIELISWTDQEVRIRLNNIDGKQICCHDFQAKTGKNSYAIDLPQKIKSSLILIIIESENQRYVRRIITHKY